MRNLNILRLNWRQAVFFLAGLLVIVADQLTKSWITSYPEGHTIFEAGIFKILHVQNTGSAFGFFPDQTVVLKIIGITGACLLIAAVFFVLPRFHVLEIVPVFIVLGTLFGGTLGNLIDRLRIGHVTDFIGVGFWPYFNVADSAVVCSTVTIAIFLLFSKRVKDIFQPKEPDQHRSGF